MGFRHDDEQVGAVKSLEVPGPISAEPDDERGLVQLPPRAVKQPTPQLHRGRPIGRLDLVEDHVINLAIGRAGDHYLGRVSGGYPPESETCRQPVFPATITANNRDPATVFYRIRYVNLLLVWVRPQCVLEVKSGAVLDRLSQPHQFRIDRFH